MLYSQMITAVDKFRRLYGVPPNTITLGYTVAHKLRGEIQHITKYTMIYKPAKIDERGNMTVNDIPVIVNYEYPDMIEISLKMKVRS